jgi:hypothetical protein
MSSCRAMRPCHALVACLALSGALSGCADDDAAPQAHLAGVLLDGTLDETSGLAASGRFPETFWLVQDGGNDALLHAISRRGARYASLRVEGVRNTDWEDLAAFAWHGRRYLLIADTGDNGGLRRTLLLHVVPEPDRLVDGATVRPAWSIAFRWPDGPRDCEAVAVDAQAGRVLLISKKRNPPELFSVPLRPGPGLVTATLLGRLARPSDMPAATAPNSADSRRAVLGRQVTSADLSPDGNTLAVLTYDSLLRYRRRPGESWSAAVARAPVTTPVPWLHQAEALAWLPGGEGLMATGEFSPAPLVFLPATP